MLVAKRERRGNRQWFGNPRAFDQEIVEAALGGEPADFAQQVIAQCATDASIGEFHKSFFRPGQICISIPDEFCVDIDLAHVVDNNRNAKSFAIAQDMIENGGLASA
jgi:hypothetical protein